LAKVGLDLGIHNFLRFVDISTTDERQWSNMLADAVEGKIIIKKKRLPKF